MVGSEAKACKIRISLPARLQFNADQAHAGWTGDEAGILDLNGSRACVWKGAAQFAIDGLHYPPF